jgi:acyl-CoA thioester hydrolase
MHTEKSDAALEPSVYSMPVRVEESDVDVLEHVSNIAYIRWVQDVAIAHSRALGFDIDAYRAMGGVFVVRRHEIDYLRPVLRGQKLELRTWLDSVTFAKCVRATEIVDEQGDVAARAMTTWGYVEFTTGRPTRIPEPVRHALGAKATHATASRAP